MKLFPIFPSATTQYQPPKTVPKNIVKTMGEEPAFYTVRAERFTTKRSCLTVRDRRYEIVGTR